MRLAKHRERPGVIARSSEVIAKVAVGLGEVGLESDRLAVFGDGVVELPLGIPGEAEIEVGVGVVGVEPDRLAIFGDGLLDLALSRQDDKVRIPASLVATETGAQAWALDYLIGLGQMPLEIAEWVSLSAAIEVLGMANSGDDVSGGLASERQVQDGIEEQVAYAGAGREGPYGPTLQQFRRLREEIDLPSIYFGHRRRVFERDGMLLADGPHVQRADGEAAFEADVRYRTVGDMTCTGAVRSTARTLRQVLVEVAGSRISERGATRADDRASDSAMEDRKVAGYY